MDITYHTVKIGEINTIEEFVDILRRRKKCKLKNFKNFTEETKILFTKYLEENKSIHSSILYGGGVTGEIFKNYRSVDKKYWLIRGWSENEAKEKSCIEKNKIIDTLLNLPEEKKKEINKKKANNLENFIRIYGEEEGTKKYYATNKKKSVSLKNYVEKYGEEIGKEKWEQYLKKKQNRMKLEWFINIYGKKEGTKRHSNWIKKMSYASSIKYYTDKYGEEKGKELFNKIQDRNCFCNASKKSLELFYILIDWLFEKNYCEYSDISLGIKGNFEYYLYNHENHRTYFYDFTIRKFNLIIEFNGIHVHPKKKNLDGWYHSFSKYDSKTCFENDKEKRMFAKQNGFYVLNIWSDISIERNIEISKNFILFCKRKIDEKK